MFFRFLGLFGGFFRLGGLFRETGGFDFFDGGDGVGGETLAAGLVSFYAYEILGLYFHRVAEGIVTAEGYLETWINLIGKQHQTGVDVLRKPVLFALRRIHEETLQVGIALLICIEENGSPYFVRLVFLQTEDVVLIVVVQVEVGQIEVAVIENDENLVFVVELAQIVAVLVVVKAFDIRIEPYLPTA